MGSTLFKSPQALSNSLTTAMGLFLPSHSHPMSLKTVSLGKVKLQPISGLISCAGVSLVPRCAAWERGYAGGTGEGECYNFHAGRLEPIYCVYKCSRIGGSTVPGISGCMEAEGGWVLCFRASAKGGGLM